MSNLTCTFRTPSVCGCSFPPRGGSGGKLWVGIDLQVIQNFNEGKVAYGTTNEVGGRGRRVIFCVHGNPSAGCCALVDDILQDKTNGSIGDAESELH
ncbi:hypothetical protein EVAR_44028_1 [Eumeta japonica]|uniref:Uncharacterized protein n=1 Tax=Eumeta variegata TaxID=151549 RepID=A0A4C1XL77_EUMVA|nr:hypothetical protein EVAR_44028_1 [Eumeta japonica]